MQEHLQIWKAGWGAKDNLCEKVMPGLVLNPVKEFSKQMDQKEGNMVQKENRGLSKRA